MLDSFVSNVLCPVWWSHTQRSDMLDAPASPPPWTTFTLNTPSGNRKCSCTQGFPGSPFFVSALKKKPNSSFGASLWSFSVGQVVNIKAKVNRAFNTSLEVRESTDLKQLPCHGVYSRNIVELKQTNKKCAAIN